MSGIGQTNAKTGAGAGVGAGVGVGAGAGVGVSTDAAANPLIPQLCAVEDIFTETGDVKTFRVKGLDGKRPFTPLPGQLAMVSMPGIGEAMFSVSGVGEGFLDISVKRVGELTDALHGMSPGGTIGIRGPYGNGFPMESLKGSNLLFIGGGIGLAPIRPAIRHCFENRRYYGHIDILCGSRSPGDLIFKEELLAVWGGRPDVNVYVTVDKGDEGWKGNVGFVPTYMEELGISPVNAKALLCGPPIMIKLCSKGLLGMGFRKGDILVTLEMRMKCGIGKCGRCNIGSKYVCLDGPVFTLAELDELPDEK